MGFKDAKWDLIVSLENLDYDLYTERRDILVKNKLYTREVSVEFVLKIIEECDEENYTPKFSPDADDKIAHIFVNNGWYIKYCLFEGVVTFISVHKDENYE